MLLRSVYAVLVISLSFDCCVIPSCVFAIGYLSLFDDAGVVSRSRAIGR